MHPVAFHIPWLNIPIYSYGVMMVVAFLATQWLATRLAKRVGIDPEIFVNVALYAMIAGVVGARLSHILENLPDFTRSDRTVWENFFAMINIRSGGLTFYGGLLLAFPVCLGYVIYHKVPGRLAMDITAPCIVLGLGIGRIGCFLNGCCYGATANVPGAVTFPYDSNAYVDQFYGAASEKLDHAVPPQLLKETPNGVRLLSPDEFRNDPQLIALAAAERSNPVIPTQLYSTFTSLLIMAILLCYFTMPHSPGRVFALMLMIEGPSRFLLELLRVEPPIIGRMSLSMLLGQMFFVAGAIMWFVFAPSSDQLPSAAQLAARQR
jgi:phosphatidylglycerol:prolipoprotein diacylglycerol transferase